MNSRYHGRPVTMRTVIAITTTQVTGTQAKNLIETKSIQIRSKMMNRGNSSMNCCLDPMELLPRPTHLNILIHLLIDAISTRIAIGRLQKVRTPSLLIHRSAHLQYQAQLLRALLAPRPIRIAR